MHIYLFYITSESVYSKSSEDKSETSSVRSSSSAAGSATNSGTNSLRGSAASSPCGSPSPSPASPLKWASASDPATGSTHPCRYFVMKCNNYKNLEISMQRGIWATTPANEKKLNKAFKVQCNHFEGPPGKRPTPL